MVSAKVGIVTVPVAPGGASAEEDVDIDASLPTGRDTDTVSVSVGTVTVPMMLESTVVEGVVGDGSIAVPSPLAGIPLAPIQQLSFAHNCVEQADPFAPRIGFRAYSCTGSIPFAAAKETQYRLP